MSTETKCPRCKREVHPWPFGHASCSPRTWVHCIRTDLEQS